MSNFSNDIEARQERKERNNVRREKLAGMFFNLTQLTYTALVLGTLVVFSQGNDLTPRLCIMSIVGGIVAYMWAKIGNSILKR